MDIKDELDAMENLLTGDGNDGTDAPSTDAVVTDAPTTEIPEDVDLEPTPTDAPTTDLPDEAATLRSELELLRSEIKGIKDNEPIVTHAPTTNAPISDEDFMAGIDFDEVARDPIEFNKLLNLVYKKGVEASRDAVSKGSIELTNTLPGIIKTDMEVVRSLEKTSKDFYSDNTDLEPWKQVVSVVFGEIATANPDKSYVDNLALTGDEVRKRLNLTKPDVIIDKGKPPKLPVNKGQRRSNQPAESKGFAAEIDAMDKALA